MILILKFQGVIEEIGRGVPEIRPWLPGSDALNLTSVVRFSKRIFQEIVKLNFGWNEGKKGVGNSPIELFLSYVDLVSYLWLVKRIVTSCESNLSHQDLRTPRRMP